ncbi:ferritin family protein [bacterium]|nr:ferritin family protein [bacterium]
MGIKFSGYEIGEMAIQIERNGKTFYEVLEKKSNDNDIRAFFKYLAEQESEHMERFKELRDSLSKEGYVAPYDWDEARDYLSALVAKEVFSDSNMGAKAAESAKDERSAFDAAIGLEKDSLLFYHEMMRFINKEDHPLVEKIAEEERKHIKDLTEKKRQRGY